MIIVVYVDDILIMSSDFKEIVRFGGNLGKTFVIRDLGNPKRCLGIDFMIDEDGIKLSQETYVRDILQRFGMDESNPISTPVDINTKLTKTDPWASSDGPKPPYRELIGALLYLAVATRPDVAHAASLLSQFNECFGKTHWIAAKRVLRYLKGTANLGIVFRRDRQALEGFVDADWAGSIHDRRSFTGYAFTMNGGCVSWDSKKQRTVALSSTEAEYMALSEAAKEAVYLRRFLLELDENIDVVRLSNDNFGAQKLATNPRYHARTKHIDIRHHFVREVVEIKVIELDHIASEEMPADVLTKAISKPKHERCIGLLGMKRISKGSNGAFEGKCQIDH